MNRSAPSHDHLPERDDAYLLFHETVINQFQPIVDRYRRALHENRKLRGEAFIRLKEELGKEEAVAILQDDSEKRRSFESLAKNVLGLYEYVRSLWGFSHEKLIKKLKILMLERVRLREEKEAFERRLLESTHSCIHCEYAGPPQVCNLSHPTAAASSDGLATPSTEIRDPFVEKVYFDPYIHLRLNLFEVILPLLVRSTELESENTRLLRGEQLTRSSREEPVETTYFCTKNVERYQLKINRLHLYSFSLYDYSKSKLNAKKCKLEMEKFRLLEENDALESRVVKAEHSKYSCILCENMRSLFKE